LLGLTLALAIGGVIVLALKPGHAQPAAWSTWRPSSGNVTKATQEIADHFSSRYHLNKSGAQLVAVYPSKPELTRYAKVSTVSTIAIHPTTQSQNFTRVFSASNTYQDQFCGFGDYCAIKGGKASVSRERLVRREALEMALYTFKYLPQVNSVIAYLPPPPGHPPSTLLLLERSGLRTQLEQPVTSTLPLAKPPLPENPDAAEAKRIDKLTLPLQYSYQYEPLSDGTVALLLAPSSV
jgi:hypothetical protein